MNPQGLSVEYIHNGVAYGNVADRLLAAKMDPLALKPYIGSDGRSYVDYINNKGELDVRLSNTPASLPKDVWIEMDKVMVKVARDPLRLVNDIVGAGLTYDVRGGLGKTMIRHQTRTDAGDAIMSMDAMEENARSRVAYDSVLMPIPIIHSGFSFPLREILASQQSSQQSDSEPLDMTMLEQSVRKMSVFLEDLTIGTIYTSGYTFGGGTIFGLKNFTYRITSTITSPTNVAFTPDKHIDELLDNIQALNDINFDGPYGVYYGRGWKKVLNNDYSKAYQEGRSTLLNRIREIEDISFARTLPRLKSSDQYTVLIVQMSNDVIQMVRSTPMAITEWDSHGGWRKNFKLWMAMIPRIRANADSQTGIVHCTAA